MAEQRIDAYPVDKMGFLTSSGLRKKSCFSVHFFIIWWQEECQVIHQVMIQTIFPQKTYYCIILPLILYQKLQRGNHFSNQFLSMYVKCKAPVPLRYFATLSLKSSGRTWSIPQKLKQSINWGGKDLWEIIESNLRLNSTMSTRSWH